MTGTIIENSVKFQNTGRVAAPPRKDPQKKILDITKIKFLEVVILSECSEHPAK